MVGLLFDLLEFDMAEAGRRGGGILLSAPKKLDLRRVLLTAGDDGSCDKLSMVRSESDGRLFFEEGLVSSTSGSFSFPISFPVLFTFSMGESISGLSS